MSIASSATLMGFVTVPLIWATDRNERQKITLMFLLNVIVSIAALISLVIFSLPLYRLEREQKRVLNEFNRM